MFFALAALRGSPFAARRRKRLAGHIARWRTIMAKGQKKSNREVRKPKAAKPKTNASQPTQKLGAVKGLENMRNK
jgi:hypothetical protein